MMDGQLFGDEVTDWMPAAEMPPHWQGWYNTRVPGLVLRKQRRWFGIIDGKLTWSVPVRLGEPDDEAEDCRASASDVVDFEWCGLVNQVALPYPLQRAVLRREAD